MLNLRVMEVSEIRRLHAVQMHRDFPPSELKGVETILNLCARNEYDVLAAELDGCFIGYALIYRPKTGKNLLLDYLAVEPEIRNRGYGHQLLEALKLWYAERAECLMIECERPKAAPDEEEARRRIRFYQDADAVLTSVRIWLFDVEYSILVMPTADSCISADKSWAREMLDLYRQMLPDELFVCNVRLIRE